MINPSTCPVCGKYTPEAEIFRRDKGDVWVRCPCGFDYIDGLDETMAVERNHENDTGKTCCLS